MKSFSILCKDISGNKYVTIYTKCDISKTMKPARNAKKNYRRDAMNSKLISQLLSWLEGETKIYRLGRLLISILILATTGIRIMELNNITVAKLIELRETGVCSIYQYKTNMERNLVLSKWAVIRLKYYLNKFRMTELPANLPADSLLLRKRKDPFTPLDRSHFTRLINGVLKQFVAKFSLYKNLKSHSFRIGLITELIENEVPIQNVQGIIGHKNVNTTNQYSRYQIPIKRQRSILELRKF